MEVSPPSPLDNLLVQIPSSELHELSITVRQHNGCLLVTSTHLRLLKEPVPRESLVDHDGVADVHERAAVAVVVGRPNVEPEVEKVIIGSLRPACARIKYTQLTARTLQPTTTSWYGYIQDTILHTRS